MIVRILCTQTATVICLVQTTSKNSLTGLRISKLSCRSDAPTSHPSPRVYQILKAGFPWGLLSNPQLFSSFCLSADHWKKETREGERTEDIALSVGRSAILSVEHAEVKILFQAKLSLCQHHLHSTMFWCLKQAEMTPSSHHNFQSKQISFRFSAGSVITFLLLWIWLEVYSIYSKWSAEQRGRTWNSL